VFITSFSFGIYVLARLTGPLLRDYRRRQQQSEPARQQAAPPVRRRSRPARLPGREA